MVNANVYVYYLISIFKLTKYMLYIKCYILDKLLNHLIIESENNTFLEKEI